MIPELLSEELRLKPKTGAGANGTLDIAADCDVNAAAATGPGTRGIVASGETQEESTGLTA